MAAVAITCRTDGCHATLNSARELMAHLLDHHTNFGNLFLACCNETRRGAAWIEHLKTAHGWGPRPFPCPRCDSETFGFGLPSLVKKHVHSVHDKGVECSRCGRLYSRKDFKQHVKQHDGLRDQNIQAGEGNGLLSRTSTPVVDPPLVSDGPQHGKEQGTQMHPTTPKLPSFADQPREAIVQRDVNSIDMEESGATMHLTTPRLSSFAEQPREAIVQRDVNLIDMEESGATMHPTTPRLPSFAEQPREAIVQRDVNSIDMEESGATGSKDRSIQANVPPESEGFDSESESFYLEAKSFHLESFQTFYVEQRRIAYDKAMALIRESSKFATRQSRYHELPHMLSVLSLSEAPDIRSAASYIELLETKRMLPPYLLVVASMDEAKAILQLGPLRCLLLIPHELRSDLKHEDANEYLNALYARPSIMHQDYSQPAKQSAYAIPAQAFLDQFKHPDGPPINGLDFIHTFKPVEPECFDIHALQVLTWCAGSDSAGKSGESSPGELLESRFFGLLGKKAAWSVSHMDRHGFVTSTESLKGDKLWPAWPRPSLEDLTEWATSTREALGTQAKIWEQAWDDHPTNDPSTPDGLWERVWNENIQLPLTQALPKGRPTGVYLRPRDILLQPSGSIHAPYSPNNVMMRGTMHLDNRDLERTVQLTNLQTNYPEATNEENAADYYRILKLCLDLQRIAIERKAPDCVYTAEEIDKIDESLEDWRTSVFGTCDCKSFCRAATDAGPGSFKVNSNCKCLRQKLKCGRDCHQVRPPKAKKGKAQKISVGVASVGVASVGAATCGNRRQFTQWDLQELGESMRKPW